MILAKDKMITVGGSTGEICAEVTGILQAVHEHLKEKHDEEKAEFMFNEIIKLGSMTDEESEDYIVEKMKAMDEAGL